MRLLLVSGLLLGLMARADESLIQLKVVPEHGWAGLQYGVDAKLTLKGWAESAEREAMVHRLFVEEGYAILRVPIYAMREVDDPLYARLIEIMRLTKALAPETVLFASVANGDGDRNNWLHREHKFPEAWLGHSQHIYYLNLDAYGAYLDAYLQRMRQEGVAIDWLGAFNEDNAKPADYDRLWQVMKEDVTVQRMGVEAWGLKTAVKTVPKLQSRLDLVGSHFYDDREGKQAIPRAKWTATWAELVERSTKPVWFTEATRFRGFNTDGIADLVDGLDRLFPAINGGIDGIIYYQVVNRLVNYENQEAAFKYSGFKALMNASRGQTRFRVSSEPQGLLQAVVFGAPDGGVSVHILNAGEKSRRLNLTGLAGWRAGRVLAGNRWVGSEAEVIAPASLDDAAALLVPARSYWALALSGE